MTQNNTNAELAKFRQQIDAIDGKIVDLLIKRTDVVSQVGEMKRRNAPDQCPIRPGREAMQLRRIMDAFQGTAFSPEAAAAIWRIIIGMSTSVESPLKLSIFAPEREGDLRWLAREYFGPSASAIFQPQARRVIGDLMDGKASVGILPVLHSSDVAPWSVHLMEKGKNMPKIFARIPFVRGQGTPAALAVAFIAPEPSGGDISLLVLEADHNVSQNRLQMAFVAAEFEASWLNIAAVTLDIRHHLVEIKGFITQGEPRLQSLLSSLGASILNVSILGAYATPSAA